LYHRIFLAVLRVNVKLISLDIAAAGGNPKV